MTTQGAHELVFRLTLRRGAMVKRGSDGAIDYVSPLPCPFDYGEIPGSRGEDGDPVDVVVWGALPAPTLSATGDPRYRLPLQGAVDFVDEGAIDTKVVVGDTAPGTLGRAAILAFFGLLAAAKATRARLRPRRDAAGAPPRCAVRGWLDRDAASARLDAIERAHDPDGDRP
jgi:inorganic pyrophosphatase